MDESAGSIWGTSPQSCRAGSVHDPDGRAMQRRAKLLPMTIVLDPASVIAERRHWTLAVNRNQNLLGKTMLVLQRPCLAVADLDTTEWAALRVEIGRVTDALRSLFEPDQFNYAFLMNVDAQVHLHVIPRYASPRTWRGREFTDENWGRSFDTESRRLAGDELSALVSALRATLSAQA